MRAIRGSGGVRPSRAASLLAACVGLGMLLAGVSFFIGGPIAGAIVFGLVWLSTLLAIIGYHLWNALNPHGVDHAQFHFHTEHDHDPDEAGQPRR